jgi:hypothetical protein
VSKEPRIKTWLLHKLAERQMSTNRFVQQTGNRITNASVFRWYNGTFRPTEEKLKIICETLTSLPISEKGKPLRYEEVRLEEALKQLGTKKEERPKKR